MSQGNNIFLLSPFLLYLIPLTIGPAFLSAAIYVTLGRTVVVYGSHYSRFQPQTYTYVFVSFDFVALVLQAVGGSLCSVADNPDLLNKGINIMIAGLAFQVFSLLCFIVTSVFFLTAVRRSGMAPNPKFTQLQNSFKFRVAFQIGELHESPTTPMRRLTRNIAIAIATLAIFIRCVYRVAELQGGFDSSLANNETIFDVLEGPMIMIASLALTVYHPGYAFQGQFGVAAWKQHGKKKQAESGIEDATLERKSADMSE
ncbi:MAG: hypothetical protein M1828_001890 [Chrysothrix sp. TS-e1954]|nr:MAG: hypothetical protein M1828_001890 [Chrysothrix sp. TS-e1954]